MKNIKEIYQAPIAEVQVFNTADIMAYSPDDAENDIDWDFSNTNQEITW